MAVSLYIDSTNTLRMFCGQLVFCDDTYGKCLTCLEVYHDGKYCKFGVASPCGPLNLNVAGIADSSPNVGCCAQCLDLDSDYELPVISACAAWGRIFGQVVISDIGAPFGVSTVPAAYVELGACLDGSEVVLYARLHGTMGAYFDIYKELDRQDFVHGACYFYDWVGDSFEETFTCAEADVDCAPDTNSCENNPNGCDVTLATFTLTEA